MNVKSEPTEQKLKSKLVEELKDENGVVIVEATVSLILFIFFMLLVFSFSRIYSAQQLVSHATIDCARSLAVESYYRETFSDTQTGQLIEGVADALNSLDEIFETDFFGIDGTLITNSTCSLTSEHVDLEQIVKERFAYSLANDTESAETLLKDHGIDGFSGIDFSKSKIEGDNIYIYAEYKVALYLPFAGKTAATLSKTAMSRAFKPLD